MIITIIIITKMINYFSKNDMNFRLKKLLHYINFFLILQKHLIVNNMTIISFFEVNSLL